MTWLQIRRRFVKGATCLAIVSAAVLGVTLAHGWKVDQGAASLRVDVLGRERSLVALSLADLERIVGERDPAGVSLLERHLTLLDVSWDTVHQGGEELSYDLVPTGRRVSAWPDASTKFASTSVLLESFVTQARMVETGSSSEGLAGIRRQATDLITALDETLRTLDSRPLHDQRLLAAGLLLAGVLALLATVSLRAVLRSRDRQSATRLSEQHYRALVNELPIPVVLHGASGVIQANDAAARLVGATCGDDVIGLNVDDFVAGGAESPADRTSYFNKHGDRSHSYEVQVVLPTGRATMQVHRRVIDLDGELVAMLAILDVTDRVAAEQELEASEMLHRAVLEQLSECVVLQIPGRCVLHANRAATELLGVVAGDGDLITQAAQVRIFRPDGQPIAPDESPTRAALANEGVQRSVLHLTGEPVGDRWVRVDSVALDHDIDGAQERLVLLTFADITVEKQAEFALSESETVQRIILDSLQECVILHDLDAGVIRANVSATALIGVAAGPEAFPDQLMRTVESYEADGHPLDLRDTPSQRALRSGVIETERILEYRRADGSARWMSCNALALAVPVGGAEHPVLITMVDITSRQTAQLLLEQERRLLEASFASVHSGVLAIDTTGRVLHANPAYCALVGAHFAPGDDLLTHVGSYSLTDTNGATIPPASTPLTLALSGHTTIDEPHRVVRADGCVFDVLASAGPIHGDTAIVGAVLTLHDITELRRAERGLRTLATTDPLTGLVNRRELLTYLDCAIARHARTPERLGVLFLDLDNFKNVNDTLGHEAGDELLVSTGQRLRQVVRAGDVVARLGGDEFVFVIDDTDTDSIAQLANRVETVLAEPFILTTGVVHAGCSVGTTTMIAGDTATTMLERADHGMYTHKRSRRNVR